MGQSLLDLVMDKIMKVLGKFCVVVVASIVFAGCSDGITVSGSGDDRVIRGDISGGWRSTDAMTGELAVSVTITGTRIEADVTRHTGTRCPVSRFSGTYDEDARTLEGSFLGNGNQMSWNARLEGDTLVGPYRVTTGVCVGETGSITLVRP